MKTITFDLKGCPGVTPAPISVPEIQCVAVDEIKAAEAKPGGRTVLVTPYSEDTGICSGQYGQWQVLTGFGGQIHRGMYCGDSFTKEEGFSSPGVSSTVDCEDTVTRGTKCIAVRDRGRWFVFCPKGTASGSSSSTAVCVVLGGNVFLKTLPEDPIELQDPVYRETYPVPDDTENEYGSLDEDYPSRRPFAYSLPTVGPDGNALAGPIVNDWRKYDLPEGYALGDKLPRLPDGLCYLRVERPFQLAGGESWEEGNTEPPPRPATGPQAYVKAILDGNDIAVWCRYPVDEGLPTGASPGARWVLASGLSGASHDTVNALFTVTNDGGPVTIGDRTLGVGAVSLALNGVLTVELYKFKPSSSATRASSAEVAAVGAFTIGITGVVVETSDSSTPVPAASLAVITGDIRGAVVIGLNDVSRQGFRAGDLVYIVDDPTDYEDRYGLVSPDGNQSRRVYRILGGISGVKRNITSV